MTRIQLIQERDQSSLSFLYINQMKGTQQTMSCAHFYNTGTVYLCIFITWCNTVTPVSLNGISRYYKYFTVISIFQRAKALKQKKEEGNEVFKSGRLSEAYNLYSEALKIDPNNKSTNAKLFFNRATVCSKVVSETV